MISILYKWIPNKSLGKFVLGAPINQYDNLILMEEEYDKSVEWEVYKPIDSDMLRIFVEENKIISIACYDTCSYQDTNLIGKKLGELEKILAQKPTEIGEPIELDIGGEQIPIEFDPVGLQVWIKDGVVVSAFFRSED